FGAFLGSKRPARDSFPIVAFCFRKGSSFQQLLVEEKVMQSRKGCWRTPLLTLTAVLLALAPVSAWAGSNKDVVRQQQPKSQEDTSGIRPAFTTPEAVPLKKPTLYPRTAQFWGSASGPTYGFVRAEDSR